MEKPETVSESAVSVQESVDLIDLERNYDRLAQLVKLQSDFRQKLGNPVPPNIDFSKPLSEADALLVENWVKEYADCMMMEAAELKDWTRWKHWSSQLGNKQRIRPGSRDHIHEMRVEIADLLCFLLNAAAWLGMGADELFEFYCAKRGINFARQETGTY